MTILQCQDELIDRIKKSVENLVFEPPDDKWRDPVHMNVFKQYVPAAKDDDPLYPFPYVVVKVADGEAGYNLRDASVYRMVCVIGVRRTEAAMGYFDAVGVMQRIIEDLSKHPMLEHFFMTPDPIKFAVDDDDNFPYSFAGIETKWSGQPIAQEGLYT